ncbi:nucleotide exchange factor GrpE [Alphaproteobacteria bacterium 46_93_T64]|nr:nucleotide exchange factor GrpE [Alphaproteobacteria bacterium 46_93_T64]
MNDTNPNSPEDPEMEEGMENSTPEAEPLELEDIDAATMDALSEAEAATDEVELTVEDQLIEEIADLKEKLLRAMAETQNIRRRAEKEKEDAHNYAVTKFARDMLSVSDNLRRAVDSVPNEDREIEAIKTFLTGVEMTESELLSTMTKHKIEFIAAEGAKFDPNFHQAMFEIENLDVEPGTILQVVQAGYVIAGRLLRPSLVGIAKGGKKASSIHIDEKA